MDDPADALHHYYALGHEHDHSPLRDGWTSPAEAARRLRRALATRGLSEDEVAAVLSEGGLPAADPGER